jgi:ArsR family metal-binding transcriptional regulator
MKTTEHLLLQLHKANARQLLESVICVRHNMPGFLQIRVVFPRSTASDVIINLRKHIISTYKDTDVAISVINDESHANTDAMKIQMKIKAPMTYEADRKLV